MTTIEASLAGIRSVFGRVMDLWDRFGGWVNAQMPKGLYARSLLIIVTPMVLLQSVVAFVFMERHFNLVTRRPDALPKAGQASPGRRPSVADVVREELQRRELPPDLDRARLVELGLKYLADAEAVTLAATPLEPES